MLVGTSQGKLSDSSLPPSVSTFLGRHHENLLDVVGRFSGVPKPILRTSYEQEVAMGKIWKELSFISESQLGEKTHQIRSLCIIALRYVRTS